jgi:hypothetical protein
VAQIDIEFFVRALKSECRDAAVTDCIASFCSPPGRTPRPELVQIAKWFIGLSDSERTMVESAMAEAADATLFGVLCVLDGVRAIEAEEEKAEYVISAVRAGETTQISPTETFLHDIYRSER